MIRPPLGGKWSKSIRAGREGALNLGGWRRNGIYSQKGEPSFCESGNGNIIRVLDSVGDILQPSLALEDGFLFGAEIGDASLLTCVFQDRQEGTLKLTSTSYLQAFPSLSSCIRLMRSSPTACKILIFFNSWRIGVVHDVTIALECFGDFHILDVR